MVDKKLEENIKKTQMFLEFWGTFHEMYKDMVKSGMMLIGNKLDAFSSTKGIVNSRFEDLMDFLEISPREKMEKCYPIYEILSFNDFSAVSDEKINRIKDCWTDSYIFLYALLNRFKRKKQRIEKFNKLFYVVKKSFNSTLKGGKK